MMLRGRRQRLGWTLLQALGAVAILGALLALLLPAVQAARMAARRAGCALLLRDIGVAFHSYHGTHGSFVPGQMTVGRMKVASHLLFLLPHLGREASLAQFNFDADGLAPDNFTATSRSLSCYLCPEDFTPPPSVLDPKSSYRGATNYSGNWGDGDWTRLNNGVVVVAFGRPVRAADVTDGLSKTAAYSEILHSNVTDGQWRHRPSDGLLGVAFRCPGQPPSRDEFSVRCQSSEAMEVAGPMGVGWASGVSRGLLYNHQLPPGQRTCIMAGSGPPYSVNNSAITAASRHPGGVHVLMADGSLHFVASAVDVQVWRAAGTRAGSETAAGLSGAP